MAGSRKRKSPRKPPPPAARNPYAVATRRLGHHVKPSIKHYKRKARGERESTPEEEDSG